MEVDNSPSGAHRLVESLTPRELEVLSLIADNLTNAEIAEQLTLSVNTVKWYAGQIYGKLGVDNRRQAAQRARQLSLLEDKLPAAAPDGVPHNLPAQAMPFIGRGRELAELQRKLEPGSMRRLITLLGPGGVGKTQLALQLARFYIEKDLNAFPDGVFFVPLAGLDAPASVVHAAARALGFTFSTGGKAVEELTGYLRRRQALLVLDNFEHLSGEESLGFLAALLESAPAVKLLVTSRARLNLRGETVFPLSGLETPREDQVESWDNPLDQAEKWSSLQLFLKTARQAKPAFRLTESNLPEVARICWLVDGFPLGIELAAAWAPVMTPEEIAAETGSSLDFLESQDFGLPRRQRSLRAVFDSSLKLLDEEERQAVEALSVFRGGFTRSTAQEVFGLSNRRLLALVNKCWVQPEEDGRFGMHELLRQYAGEQLRRQPDREYEKRDQHSRYFCRLLAEREDDWHGERQLEALAEIEGEIENIQAAWNWAAREGKLKRIDRALGSLSTYYEWRSRFEDGAAACRVAVERIEKRLQEHKPPDADTRRILARLLIWQTRFGWDIEAGRQRLNKSEKLLQSCQEAGLDVQAESIDLYLAQSGYVTSKDRVQAKKHNQKALILAERSRKQWKKAAVLFNMAGIAFQTGEFEEVRRRLEQALPIQRELGDRLQKGRSLNLLGLILAQQGQLEEAEALHQECLTLYQEIGLSSRTATLLANLANTFCCAGKFEEAHEHAKGSLKAFHDLGYGDKSAFCFVTLAFSALHLGDYYQVKEYAGRAIEIAGEQQHIQWKGFGLHDLGCAQLAEGKLMAARENLQAAYELFQNLQQNQLGMPCARLAYILRRLDQREQAARQARMALENARQTGIFLVAVTTLPALALLSADGGDWEQAVRLHALAWRYDHVANSRWFRVIAGDELEAMFQDLDGEMVRAARENGRKLDLWATVGELLRE